MPVLAKLCFILRSSFIHPDTKLYFFKAVLLGIHFPVQGG